MNNQNTKMTAEDFKKSLSAESFRGEINHLLHTSPFTNKKCLHDAGWQCREHALFIGILAIIHGFPAFSVSGKSVFISTKVASSAEISCSLDVSPHTWIFIEGIGSCDLSVRLKNIQNFRGFDELENYYLLGSRYIPHGTVDYSLICDPYKYEMKCNQAKYTINRLAAIYRADKTEELGPKQIKNSIEWCTSPLTVRLKQWRLSQLDIYAKAILHLNEILCGNGRSLRSRTQLMAWKSIGKRPGNGINELISDIGTHN